MKIYGIDHIQIAMPAGQEAKARAFYGDLLGLKEIPKPPELASRGGVWFEATDPGPGGLKVHLGVEHEFHPARKAHPGFLVKDLPGLAAKIIQAGYETASDVPLQGYHRLHIFDPFGNRIELLEPVS
jgi:catechol 2,3-dioxygenase-like lactoylglutathione lyase family enzyme